MCIRDRVRLVKIEQHGARQFHRAAALPGLRRGKLGKCILRGGRRRRGVHGRGLRLRRGHGFKYTRGLLRVRSILCLLYTSRCV